MFCYRKIVRVNTEYQANRKRYAEYIAAGKCGSCGKPREPQTRGGATATKCRSCADKVRARERTKDRQRIAAGKCAECGKRHNTRKADGTKTTLCADCARKQRTYAATTRLRKKPDLQPVFGPATTEARYVGRAAKRLGPSAAIGFHINKPTMEAIDELKRRYKVAHPGQNWQYHLAEILRGAIADVLKKGGPVLNERDRLCVPGWHHTLRMPIAQYEQITQIANQRFHGSRAAAVRFAICQAVHWPFRVTYGPKKIFYGVSPNDPWDD